MSQVPTVTPPATTAPKLHHALGSLELDLEAELRRYRRHRTNNEIPERHQWRNQATWQGTSTASVEVTATPSEPPSHDIPLESHGSRYDGVSLPTPESPAARSPEVTRVLEMLQQPDGKAGDRPELLNLEDQQVPPQDYLESSEELLKNVDLGEPQAQSTRKKAWTPKQLGFVGAAIAGVVILGVVIVPKFLSQSKPTGNTATVTPAPDLLSTPSIHPSNTEPTTVNLASQEFVDLSLDNLSVITPTEPPAQPPTAIAPTQPPTAQPTPASPQQPLTNPTGRDNLAAALLPPSLRPQPVTPFPVTPQVAVTQPTNNGQTYVTPDGLKVGYYYVIYRNTSPKSLGKARELVKDAFVRTFPVGRAVQLAELQDQAKAQALVKKFNDAKIAAELYHHQLSPVSQQ